MNAREEVAGKCSHVTGRSYKINNLYVNVECVRGSGTKIERFKKEELRN